ncbi:hypothetical protein HZB04_01910 [Candidatus Wolfebacteria bacterium]|nr:hypothetical protein [Candidatus Wolfebacteria bacterium]
MVDWPKGGVMDKKNKTTKQFCRIILETEDPQKIGDQWQILATVIANRDKWSLVGQPIQFFLNGLKVGNPAQTDENGRTLLNIDIPSNIKSATIEAQIVGQAIMARKIVVLPKEDNKQVPAELIVNPARINNQISFLILVVDEKNIGVKKAKITVVDSGTISTVSADEDGEYIHKIDIQQGEEREIAFYAAGYGDRGFRRTFRGM